MRPETKQIYARYGIDVEEALQTLSATPISIQCWQLDDVDGFLEKETLSGGIQSTGNHPGKARNFEELTADLDVALSLIPGKKKVNLHAIYQSDDPVDRKDIAPKNFRRWVDYAKSRGLGLDFNPTMFSSPHMDDGLSLSSPKKEVRD